MPTRILRDGILKSKRVDALSPLAELFYRRLMSVVDDFGRYSADLRELRAGCYPLRIDTVKDKHIQEWLDECSGAGLLIVYRGKREPVLQMVDFGQRERGKSKFEAPPATDDVEKPVAAERSNPPQVAATCGDVSQKDAVVEVEVGCVVGVVVEDGSARARAAAPPPPGVDAENWSAWVKQKGKTQTPEADRLQRKHLAEWLEQGLDVNRIVENGVAGHWKGLFPPKMGPPGREPDRKTRGMDVLAGRAKDERAINGTAERVDRPPVLAIAGAVRVEGVDASGDGGPERGPASVGGRATRQ